MKLTCTFEPDEIFRVGRKKRRQVQGPVLRAAQFVLLEDLEELDEVVELRVVLQRNVVQHHQVSYTVRIA